MSIGDMGSILKNIMEQTRLKGGIGKVRVTVLFCTAVRSGFPSCSLFLCEVNSVQYVMLRRGSLAVHQRQVRVGSQHYQGQEHILRINIYNF